MDRQTDRRIQRTRKLLREAIIALVLQKGYDNTSVEDITEQANLGRTTFYLHYKDKRELLLDSLGILLDDLFAAIYSKENLERWEKEGTDPRKMVFIHAAENADLFRLLFDGEVGGTAISYFRQHLADIFNEITVALQEKFDLTPRVPNQVSTSFLSGALTGLLTWWLQNDMPYSPEEIYDMYHYLMANGTVKGIGFDEIPGQE